MIIHPVANSVFLALKDPWVIFGLFAQLVFFFRFVFQWVTSERAGKVVVPAIFWYLSIVGAVMIFIYALHREDIVFIVASFLSLFIYSRNIVLHIKNHNKQSLEDLSKE